MRFAILLFLVFRLLSSAFAQSPCSNTPGMTPQTAIAVCGTTTFTQVSVNTCTGPDISGSGACGGSNSSDNAFWYKFHCYQSGTLGFLITPQNLNDDYDWEVFNVTGVSNLNQLYTDERLMVSLNLCGAPNGITGCAVPGIDSINCGGNTALLNRPATLYAGNDYLLMVNRYSNSPLGYTLKFAGGTAVITDPALPVISSAATDGCNNSLIKVIFSKDISCSSVTATGSEFSISPAGPVITGISSACVSPLGTITELTIQLQNPLGMGIYDLIVNPGSDANTFTDVCGNNITTGFTIPLFVSVSDPPIIQSFGYDECHRDRIVVNFDKPVACTSLTTTGSEFRFSPPGPIITSINSNCGSSAFTSSVTLFLAPVPTLPTFSSILIYNGTDGNTLSDTCASYIPQGYGKTFTAPLPPPPVFDSVQLDECNPTFVKVFFNHPILCSSIRPDGQPFHITGPAPVNVISATADVTCSTLGYSNWISLQLSAPITTTGTYRVVVWNIGVAVIDTCNAPQQPFEFIPFNVAGTPLPAFNSQVKWGCVMDTIQLSHSGGNGANSWTWNFSDGTSATGQNVSHTFPVTTPTATVQLIVSNGTCTDSLTKTFVLGNFFKAGFSNNPVDSFCVNTPVTFTDTSKGNISNYLWDFGDLTQFNGQNPPAHIYPVSNNYNIKLVVTDMYGCTDTTSVKRFVTPAAFIDFTGLKPQYCTGNQIVLKRKISSFITGYVWDNGDGKTFTNEVDVNFSYAAQGVYTITLSGVDRYCGTASASKTVPVYKVPVVKLPADTVLCQNDQMLIGVASNPAYTYLWNTGETISQLLTSIFTRDYKLTVENNGCKGIDAMHVKVLTACVIKMPNAFTPNRDGINDELLAPNADLAKNFSLKIFNRIGQLMFSTNNPLQGWDGRFKGNPQETGTYVWMLSYTDPWNGKFINQKGTSILLR